MSRTYESFVLLTDNLKTYTSIITPDISMRYGKKQSDHSF